MIERKVNNNVESGVLNAKEIKEVLERNSVNLRESWGQNFLIDKNILEKIISFGNLSKKDTIIEVGPGLGALTFSLAKNTKRVIAVEKDKKLIPLLRENLLSRKNVDIVNQDILSLDLRKFNNYKLVGNIPYYITSPIIKKFLETENRPSLLLLTVQKEVAQRVCAKPPQMNLLAVSVQFFATAEVLAHISPASFYPPPSVTSSILRIIPYNKESVLGSDFQERFFSLVRAGFSHPRKQLKNNLALLNRESKDKVELKNIDTEEILKEAGINPERRAETLSIEEWKNLTKKIKK